MHALPPALFLAVAVFLGEPTAALSASAVSCHCFRDRSYDATRPAAVDPYLLATARNSLLAAAFGIDKGEVVRSLMTGTSPDDLWVAHWVAAETGSDAGTLLETKAATGTWSAAIAGAGLDPARLRPAFARRVSAGAAPSALAAAAADAVLVNRLRADPKTLQTLRARGASTQEVILCTLLAPRARRAPADLLADHRSGHRSWGALVNGLGLEPTGLEAEIRRALKR